MMFEERLRILLAKVASGEVRTEAAMAELRNLPFNDLGFARVDQHRQLRQGMPEIIFCPGKTSKQINQIAGKLLHNNDFVLATRASVDQANEVLALSESKSVSYLAEAKSLVWGSLPEPKDELGTVAVVTAGTSDLPVAKEAELVLKAAGIRSKLIADVGVAGLHRVLDALTDLRQAKVCIVIAGMDGVLPSVLGGLLACPVIACPSSIGYGSSFDGLAALLTMLNSCAAGVSVVNIDNGFGAAMAAFRIVQGNTK